MVNLKEKDFTSMKAEINMMDSSRITYVMEKVYTLGGTEITIKVDGKMTKHMDRDLFSAV